ncbi:hypothetical protein [Yinghuangia seranimata]|uniref:hypothetical protein n=1 Tax=Yinghuangia seranimata TaxID=408067 RepID=UPI00248D3161|nr:hypothetical protein [Yinghuangia seranimata]MDI2132227.1 hypothetical protein [Yinghuangia seranimata]
MIRASTSAGVTPAWNCAPWDGDDVEVPGFVDVDVPGFDEDAPVLGAPDPGAEVAGFWLVCGFCDVSGPCVFGV